ncbi:MAG: helix-turn-helix transcriptional regulator [Deltaproteobacteria bacterium]|nr:MAG: helix-turn-helix transcriptional regulator [Deltaproteobacteria bacterium]
MGLKETMQRVGRNVRKARNNQKITQEQMRDLGFNYRYYQKIEAGEVNVTLDTLVKLSRALKCPITNFLK